MTELTGDVLLDCTNGYATANGGTVPQVNIVLYYNTPITSRTYDSTGVSEALLLIDEPGSSANPTTPLVPCATPTVGCPITIPVGGIASGTFEYGTGGRPNVYRGIVFGNTITFIGIPVDAPGTTSHRILRVTNVRANASGVMPGPSGTPGTIQALVTSSGNLSAGLNIVNATVPVGWVAPGLSFSVKKRGDENSVSNGGTDISYSQSSALSRTSSVNSAVLSFTETLPNSFRLKGGAQLIPGTVYNTESGVNNGGASLGAGYPADIGVASAGTRLKATFSNIPAGASVYVSTNLVSPVTGTSAQLVTSDIGAMSPVAATYSDFLCNKAFTNINGGSATCATSGTGNLQAAQLTVVNGSATAVWEVTGANALTADPYNFLVFFSFPAGTNPGTATVTGGFAPTASSIGISASNAGAASQTAPLPRFVEPTQASPVLTITSSAPNSVGGPLTCTAGASIPPTLRSEGLTELVGDLLLDCTNGTPTATGAAVPQVNIVAYYSTPVTSRTYDSTGTSEVLLLVDEPGSAANPTGLVPCSTPAAGCTMLAPGGTGFEYGTGGRPNVYRGIVSGNTVTFIGVPVDAPGPGVHRVLRIVNVRANASGVTAGSSGTPGAIQALVTSSGNLSAGLNIVNATVPVGYVAAGLTFSVRKRSDETSTSNNTSDISYAQCSTLSRTATTNSAVLAFSENIPNAFKVKGGVQLTPGLVYNSESGFNNGGASIGGSYPGDIGVATAGTRLKAIFSNIPAGVSVYVSNNLISPVAGTSAQLVVNEAGATTPASITNSDFLCNKAFTGINGGAAACAISGTGNLAGAQLAVVNNSATAVWEVTGANALTADQYNFLVLFSYTASAATNSPAPGTATVTGGFAPTASAIGISASAAGAASTSAALPRFVEASQNKPVFTSFVCRTNLLFPFVTNQSSFDTGLVIADTSTDPFVDNSGKVTTTPQNGSCTLYSYGANPAASLPTGPIAAGTAWTTLASTSLPNFQGYVIAQCTFQFGHGFAFVSDFGAQKLAMAYLGLVIPEPGSGSRSAGTTGESLSK